MPDTTAIGNAGEHLLMAHLLQRGYQAFMVDRCNTAFDIACVVGQNTSLLRVKTTTANLCKWTAKNDGTIFLDMRQDGDLVALIDMRKGVSESEIYFVPTTIVNQELEANRKHYLSFPKKNGEARKDTPLRGLHLSGEPTPTDISYGFHKKWENYKWAWEMLI